ncbi:STAS domain-containing protein [Actinoplanes sp. NPDC089786]|uniref:STAS domain-containing protein n=1 Tax=Actinoplanes sp. NPDC089786 TaxID=3155185 RepID=UPI003419D1A8
MDVAVHGRTAAVTLTGEFDLSNCATLRDALTDALLSPDTRKVVIDMAGVAFVDSTTLSALVEAYRIAQAQGKAVAITTASPRADRILRMTGLLDLFTEQPDTRSVI